MTILMSIDSTSIPLGSLLAIAGFFFAAVGTYQAYVTRVRKNSQEDTKTKILVTALQKDFSEFKLDYVAFKKEVRDEFKEQDTYILQRMDIVDKKLDAIKDLMIKALSDSNKSNS